MDNQLIANTIQKVVSNVSDQVDVTTSTAKKWLRTIIILLVVLIILNIVTIAIIYQRR